MAKGRTKDTHTHTRTFKHDKCATAGSAKHTHAHRDMQTGEQQVMVINFAYAKGSTAQHTGGRKDELKLPSSDWGRLQSALQSVAHRIYYNYDAVKHSV